MKGRLYTGGVTLILIALITSAVLMLFGKKVEVSAASAVFVNQPYNVHFSQELNGSSLNNGYIYLTDSDGGKVKTKITIQKNKQSLTITHNTPGEYTLHVEKQAFKNFSTKTKKQTIDFKVIEEIEQITSKQDLEDFFQNVLAKENRLYNNAEMAIEESANISSDSAQSKSAGSSHSTTNNQVKDVEEGDIVITDGNYIYSMADNDIIITDVSNPKSMKVVSEITLTKDSYPTKLMKHQDKLIVIADQYIETKKDGYIYSTSMTKVSFYDVTEASKPKLIREIGQDGYLNDVRMSNDNLYIVSNKTPEYWLMSEENVELRPYMYDTLEGEKMHPMEYEMLSILPGAMEPNYTIISAIDLNNFKNEKVETKGYLGGSSTLYMSKNSLYLTAVNYLPPSFSESQSFTSDRMMLPIAPTSTDIYKFTINGTKVEAAGSTSIDGSVLNQFSMDEHDGFFRVAVTEGNTWGTGDQSSKNHLFIFDEQMEKVGEVKDLAKGERIYSARFMGDKAYLVTFKQVDPLFVIDLTDPKKPTVLGELKIPGYSNYLHPLDENHLIGFGYETETRVDSYSKEPFVTTTGMKVSLFDITDFSNPKEQDVEVIGDRGTYSELQHNHKALFTNSEYDYYGFPITVYQAKGEFDIQYKGTGAVVYEITPDKGIELKGDLITPAKAGEQYEEWESMITRMMYIDDTLYTVSRKEIKSYNLQDFKAISNVKLK